MHSIIRRCAPFFLTVLLVCPQLNHAATADEAAIQQVLMTTWDQPQTKLEVGPIVVGPTHAIAGWTQGQRGGRALMVKNKEGQWRVAACGGDALKSAKTLESAGIPAGQAKALSQSLAQAERNLPAHRVALFATFGSLAHMDGGAHAGNHGKSHEAQPSKP